MSGSGLPSDSRFTKLLIDECQHALIFVIKETIATATWDDLGGPGTIAEYGGLLVVSQTSAVHEQIVDLLDQLAEKLATPAAK